MFFIFFGSEKYDNHLWWFLDSHEFKNKIIWSLVNLLTKIQFSALDLIFNSLSFIIQNDWTEETTDILFDLHINLTVLAIHVNYAHLILEKFFAFVIS